MEDVQSTLILLFMYAMYMYIYIYVDVLRHKIRGAVSVRLAD